MLNYMAMELQKITNLQSSEIEKITEKYKTLLKIDFPNYKKIREKDDLLPWSMAGISLKTKEQNDLHSL